MKFIIQIRYSDECSYSFTETIPFQAPSLEIAETDLLKIMEREGVDESNVFDKNLDVLGLHLYQLDDVTIMSLEDWFKNT